MQGIGRWRANATLRPSLNAELDGARPQPCRENARDCRGRERSGIHDPRGSATRLRGSAISKQRLLVLQGLVLAVLLIACANVANLQLARPTARGGARRARRARRRHGAARAVARARKRDARARGRLRRPPVRVRRHRSSCACSASERASDGFELELDAVVLIVTVGAALVAALLSALVPLFELFREDFARAVQESGRANTGGLVARRWRSALVVIQLAAGVTLLAGAGLLTKTFYELQRQGPGFEPDGVWSAGVELPKDPL